MILSFYRALPDTKALHERNDGLPRDKGRVRQQRERERDIAKCHDWPALATRYAHPLSLYSCVRLRTLDDWTQWTCAFAWPVFMCVDSFYSCTCAFFWLVFLGVDNPYS